MAVLLMTGYAAERQRAHNLEALIHKVIAKPFAMADLLAAVDEALAKRAPHR
jgi:DNA-binding response OmpR family regulator